MKLIEMREVMDIIRDLKNSTESVIDDTLWQDIGSNIHDNILFDPLRFSLCNDVNNKIWRIFGNRMEGTG